MGLNESKCVKLSDSEELADFFLNESYTVIRTGGTHEDGWRISSEPHSCSSTRGLNYNWNPSSHAMLKEEGWRVFLVGKEPEDSCICGWRRLGTFWPTCLTGNQVAIDQWTAELKSTLERLARRAGLPTKWEEHTCFLGAPRSYCPGCCSEREAEAVAAK